MNSFTRSRNGKASVTESATDTWSVRFHISIHRFFFRLNFSFFFFLFYCHEGTLTQVEVNELHHKIEAEITRVLGVVVR